MDARATGVERRVDGATPNVRLQAGQPLRSWWDVRSLPPLERSEVAIDSCRP